jgi:TonB-dependent starch-binding outer membrane protein SusC
MRKLLLLSALLLCATVSLWAQRTISGRVTDDKGTPLANVSVQVKGTNAGTVTGADGTYSLTVPANGKTLVFSSVDMTAREVAVGSQTSINTSLASADKSLQEVVVVGYGTQRRKDVTSSIATIGSEKIKDIPVQSFEQALAGKAAGLNVSLPNGVLNNPPVVRIRGANSITGSTFPLVVVDGVPMTTGDISTNLSANNALGNINPSDIESIDILKDAAATAIYGSRAANGVMLITTKKGRAGKARVSYDAWAGWTKAFNLFEVLDANQYVAIKNEALKNNPGVIVTGQPAGSPLFFLDTINGKQVNTNWADEIYQTGFQHNHNISIAGGAQGSTYYLSANYTKQEGMLQTNTFDRKQLRMNISQRVTDFLKIGGNFNFSRGGTRSPSTGSIPNTAFSTAGSARLAFVTAPNVSPYLADGRYNIMGLDNAIQRNSFNQIGRNKNLFNSGFVNPSMIRDLNIVTSQNDQILADVNAEIKLLKGLTFRTQYGVNWQTVEDKTYYNPLHGDGIQTSATTDDGLAQNVLGKYNTTNFQNYITYDFSLANRHNFNIVAGGEENRATIDRWGGQRSGATDASLNEYQGSYTLNDNPPQNLITENYLLSFFGRANYNYKNRYYLGGTIRRDGYSAYAAGKKWGTFGGVSVGWNISDENFWKGSISNVINSLRFRGSYGSLGNITSVTNFGALTQYGSFQYGNGNGTIFFAQAGNPNLSWETSTKTDLGFSFGLFGDVLSGDIGYYRSDLSKLIINVPTPPSMGVPGNSIQDNAASMYNKGFEFSLTARILRNKAFTWTSNFNLTTQKNEVTKLRSDVPEIVGNTQLERTNVTRVGESIGSFFVVRTNGVDAATGQRIFLDKDGKEVLFNFGAPAAQRWKYRDGTVAPAIDLGKDGVIAGNALPTVYGGFTNTFGFKGFDLNVDAIYSFGNKVYFGSRAGLLDQRFWNNSTEVLNRWQKAGDQTDIPRVVFNDNISNGSAFPISDNLYEGGFVKVRNIILGYSLPTKMLERAKLSTVRLYGQVQNPFVITNYPGVDPEISSNGNVALTPGVDRNTVGQARTFTIGINVGF